MSVQKLVQHKNRFLYNVQSYRLFVQNHFLGLVFVQNKFILLLFPLIDLIAIDYN